MQSAYETYETLADRYVGDYVQKEVFAPVSHIVARADIEVTLDIAGRFISAEGVDKNEPKIIIPVTEKSAGRTSVPEPHPLCEQIAYLSGEDEEKRRMYIAQLTDWVDFSKHPSLNAVLTYINGGTLLQDLIRSGLTQLNDDGTANNGKALIRWRILGADVPDCWKDRTLFDSFIRFYASRDTESEKAICMLDGRFARTALQHPKGIVALHGNAKLISANDREGFTYRGRFTSEDQALTVSYEASQKAHNALRWLIANQGVSYGRRTFVSWNPKGIKVPLDDMPLLLQETDPILETSVYYEKLRETLRGWQVKLPPEENVIIASFDAATTGRLSLTYFNELCFSELLERMFAWDATCCWWNGKFGIQAPSLYYIAVYAFGSRKDESRIECEDRILKQQIQRLLSCRIESSMIPNDVEQALFERCQRLYLYSNALRAKLLFTACAVIRKYHMDKKETYSLALEPEKKDISYQYGRLLAVLEKAEQDTYYRTETRMTNAIRLQSMYIRQPMRTFNIIMDRIKKEYYPKLNPAQRMMYERLISNILYEITECPQEIGNALKDTCLLGYYLQKKELYTKYEAARDNEEEDDNGYSAE